MSERIPQKLGKVIKIDEDQIQQHLGELVRGTVEETLNKLLKPLHNLLKIANANCAFLIRFQNIHKKFAWIQYISLNYLQKLTFCAILPPSFQPLGGSYGIQKN